MKVARKSYKDLIASIQQCLSLNKSIGRSTFSRFNLSVLSFLCNRGFVANFKFIKSGAAGYISFTLRRINGSLVLKNIELPSCVSTHNYKNRSLTYQSKQNLLRIFSSEFVVVSTTRGLMTSHEAVSFGIGGAILCIIK